MAPVKDRNGRIKKFEKKFVQLVKERPILYDASVKTEKKKEKLQECWHEVSREMISNFNDLNKDEQTKRSRKLKTRWKTMMDNMRRCHKAGKTTYYLYEMMKFMIPHLGKRIASDHRKKEKCKQMHLGSYNEDACEETNKPYLLPLLNKENKENLPSSNILHIIQVIKKTEDLQNVLNLYINLPDSVKPFTLQKFKDTINNAAKMSRNMCDTSMEEMCGFISDPQNEESNILSDTILSQNPTLCEEEICIDHSQFLDSFRCVADAYPMFQA